jgi:protein-S-isoprenylcysteine O-methyltransferase Ste14
VREFHIHGSGISAPSDPPRTLVRTGLYRHSRYPIYLSMAVLLLGWSAAYASIPLLAYATAAIIGFDARVVLAEEPWLSRKCAVQWQAWCKEVPRWLVRT